VLPHLPSARRATRRSFIRLAIIHGVPVVPAFCFGSSDLYYTSRFLHGLRKWLVRNARIAIPLYSGRCAALLRRGRLRCAARTRSCLPHRHRCYPRFRSSPTRTRFTRARPRRRWGMFAYPTPIGFPLPVPQNIVFGEPLLFPQSAEPSTEEVAKAHEQFIAALTALFDEHKGRFGCEARSLEVL
jgi:1-acyl-sn-glycerol-3-phosphate acyltransferase